MQNLDRQAVQYILYSLSAATQPGDIIRIFRIYSPVSWERLTFHSAAFLNASSKTQWMVAWEKQGDRVFLPRKTGDHKVEEKFILRWW